MDVLAIITTERDGYYGKATVIYPAMLSATMHAWRMRLMRHAVFCVVLALMCLISSNLTAQQLAFELMDWRGELRSVQPQSARLTVVCFLGTECPMARAYVGRLNAFQQAYQDQGVRVIGVISNRQDSLQDVTEYALALDVEFDLVLDPHGQVADRFGAKRTPEVFLLDRELKLRYHGRIDDQYAPGVARATATREDLQLAIDELLAAKPVSVKETPVLGCLIGRDTAAMSLSTSENPSITFADHILPLLERNCIECHRKGEIGPFAMHDYDEVVGWADTMLETIENGRMPPWHADPAHGRFANARLMSDSDKQLFRGWIALGLPEGQGLSPTPKQFVEGWQFSRAPDAIFPMRNRPFTVPKQGVVEYQYFVVDPQFQEDKWVSAAQVVPGSRDVVHHAIVFVRPPDGAQFQGVGWLTAYVPGQRNLPLPAGRARKIPAGSKLVFQMHYTPNGTPREDITSLGLQFAAEADVTHDVFTLMAVDQEFEIPPQASEHSTTAALPWLPAQGELLSVTPHMHYRGKSFSLMHDAMDVRANASEQILLRVPNYDFNWQHTYLFETPLPLQELSGLRFTATFDNSQGNPFNPDPSEWVTWGDQTWEEMAVAFLDVSVPRNVALAAGRRQASEVKHASNPASADQTASQIEAYVARVLAKMDTNGDGEILKSEAPIVVREFSFSRWDRNRDNVVTQDEIRQIARKLYQ